MLSYRTIEPHTLELLKYLMAEPYLNDCRLVGGTALALQYGHKVPQLFHVQDTDGLDLF